MGKKITALIKLALPAGKATPAPPVGPALGQHGVNIAAFCKEYNARTTDKVGLIIPVEISVFEDRSYTFILKTPPASVLLANAAKIKSGSSTPNKEKKIIPVEISVFEDRSYTFILKTPPASVLLANAAKIKSGSSTPNK